MNMKKSDAQFELSFMSVAIVTVRPALASSSNYRDDDVDGRKTPLQ